MRFRSLTREELKALDKQKRETWHRWFAWKPVRLTSDEHEIRWMEYVYRRGKMHYSDADEWWKWQKAALMS
jgi:hypothetical protein